MQWCVAKGGYAFAEKYSPTYPEVYANTTINISVNKKLQDLVCFTLLNKNFCKLLRLAKSNIRSVLREVHSKIFFIYFKFSREPRTKPILAKSSAPAQSRKRAASSTSDPKGHNGSRSKLKVLKFKTFCSIAMVLETLLFLSALLPSGCLMTFEGAREKVGQREVIVP